MKNFITLQDLVDLKKTIALAKSCKEDPFANAHLGQRKTIGLLFFNPSLRTRLSTQKARNLGLDVWLWTLAMRPGQSSMKTKQSWVDFDQNT